MDELESNIGIRDIDLAEFIIFLAKQSSTFEEFSRNLHEKGADFPPIFSNKLYDIIKTTTVSKFPGLAIDKNSSRSRSPSRLKEGRVYECTVTNLMSFGFLVEAEEF